MSQLPDPFTDIARLASILGDLRKALVGEGFTPEEAFDLIVMMINNGAIQ
jgi:hypothetical protein